MKADFTITNCTTEDGPGLACNNINAFSQDSNWARSWRHTTIESVVVGIGKKYPQTLLKNRIGTRHQKAVDLEGRIVGYARWLLPESLPVVDQVHAWPEAIVPAVSEEDELEINRIADAVDCRPINSEDDSEFDRTMRLINDRYLASRAFLNLDYLAVHPDSQGKGIASALVQSGLQQAKALKLDAFVLAYNSGIGLYAKQGFEVLEELVSHISGSDKPYRACFMAYEHMKAEE